MTRRRKKERVVFRTRLPRRAASELGAVCQYLPKEEKKTKKENGKRKKKREMDQKCCIRSTGTGGRKKKQKKKVSAFFLSISNNELDFTTLMATAE